MTNLERNYNIAVVAIGLAMLGKKLYDQHQQSQSTRLENDAEQWRKGVVIKIDNLLDVYGRHMGNNTALRDALTVAKNGIQFDAFELGKNNPFIHNELVKVNTTIDNMISKII